MFKPCNVIISSLDSPGWEYLDVFFWAASVTNWIKIFVFVDIVTKYDWSVQVTEKL